MESLFILIPIALVFVAIAIAVFFWAVKSGQYEDLDTEARRILFDGDRGRRAKPILPDDGAQPLEASDATQATSASIKSPELK